MNVFNACARWSLLLLSASAWSAEKATTVLEPAYYGGRVLLFLLLVIGLIVALAWLLNKTRAAAGISGANQAQFKVVAVLNLGMKEKVAVIQVGEQQLVVGVTAQNISLLTELAEPLPVAEQQSMAFSELLKKAIRS